MRIVDILVGNMTSWLVASGQYETHYQVVVRLGCNNIVYREDYNISQYSRIIINTK